MSLKNSRTTASYIEWPIIQNLILKLERDRNFRFCLLVSLGVYTGLRVNDLLHLRYSDVLNKENLLLVEKKTGKQRLIRLSPNLKEILCRVCNEQKVENFDELIFLNRYKTKPISVQYVNKQLKRIALKYKITTDPSAIKSHVLRKSFGRKVYESTKESEYGLMLLSEIFKHSSLSVTRRYLGIRQDQIDSVYLCL